MSQSESATTSATVAPPETETFPKLSNRGNKLCGKENPGSVRPNLWNKKEEMVSESDDFEVSFVFECQCALRLITLLLYCSMTLLSYYSNFTFRLLKKCS